jgi:TonB family protein
LAAAESAPAQQTEEAVDFTTDPHGESYGGGVVAVGGTARFGSAGARVGSPGGAAPQAPVVARPVADALVPASDLSRKPQLPGSDPCRGFFPAGAQDDVGDVAVIVTINKAGRVTNAQLLSETPTGQGFGVAARTCLKNQQFTPALDRAGNSAATAVRVNLRFSR